MQPAPQRLRAPMAQPDRSERSLLREYRVYQVVTVAAIMLVPASLWVF